MSLSGKKCVPCEIGAIPLDRTAAEKLQAEIPGWDLSPDAKKISRKFKCKNFKEALQFANKVGEIAEAEGHHPDMNIGWGKVVIALTTHSIQGLSENDFILAAKINML